jgi:hypothetical protein
MSNKFICFALLIMLLSACSSSGKLITAGQATIEDFWAHTDWFNQQYLREQLVLFGIFDLNRYQNR